MSACSFGNTSEFYLGPLCSCELNRLIFYTVFLLLLGFSITLRGGDKVLFACRNVECVNMFGCNSQQLLTVVIFVSVDLQPLFRTQFTGMSAIYRHTELHML